MSFRRIDGRAVAATLARRAPYRPLVSAGVALAADVAFDPVHRHLPLCSFHAATGLWCPLCGALRAADALAHGHLGAALHYNLLLVAAVPFVMAWWLDATARSRRGASRRRVPPAAIAAVLVLAVVFTVLRNTPWGHALRMPG